MIQPVWYVKQLEEVKEGKRHEYPCGGKIVARQYRSNAFPEGEYDMIEVCHKCGVEFERVAN